MLPHVEEKVIGFQNHQKETQVHFNFSESSVFLSSRFSQGI